jgi:hypothetical protein
MTKKHSQIRTQPSLLRAPLRAALIAAIGVTFGVGTMAWSVACAAATPQTASTAATASVTPETTTQATNPTIASEDAAVKAVSQQADEADQLITNRLMRANAGSLSKWSVRSFWTYRGGSIADPIDVTRPNITGASDTAALHGMSGNIGVRYRLNTKNALNLSMGLYMASPFHFNADIKDSRLRNEYDTTARKLTANDPTLTYQHLNKFYGIQSVSSVDLSLLTSEFSRNVAGMRTSTTLSQNLMYEIGKSGLSLGGSVSGTMYTFGGDVDSSRRARYVLGLYPQAEYIINDTFNLRTVTGILQVEFLKNGDRFTRTIYQSVGLGISATRDIFLYPNIQFLPGELRANRTNVAFNANINMF